MNQMEMLEAARREYHDDQVQPVDPEVLQPVAPEVLQPVAPEVLQPVTPEVLQPVAPEVLQPVASEVLQLGNAYLGHLVDSFLKTLRGQINKTQVVCFLELKSSNVGRILGKQDGTVS